MFRNVASQWRYVTIHPQQAAVRQGIDSTALKSQLSIEYKSRKKRKKRFHEVKLIELGAMMAFNKMPLEETIEGDSA